MRIFTKSLLTLVLLCVAGVVSAQGTVKGWFEVDASCVSREPGYQEGDHPSRVEDGATVIYARSNEGINDFVAWDTQFFITIGKDYALKEGGKFRLRMKVKADNPTGEAATQAHAAPGTYNAEIGKITFTDSWEDFDTGEITLSSDQGKNDGFYSFAINLGLGDENTFYFKDIVFEIYGDKPATPTVVSQKWQWTEMINNNDCEGTDNSSYWYRTFPYNKGDQAINAEIVDGAGKEGRGVKVVTTECGDIDNQYDPTNDIGGHAWDNQFWFSFNEEIPAGAHYKVSFDYRAEEDLTVGTQAHNTPGEYNHYQMFGDLNFTSEWKTYTGEGNISGDQSKEDKPMLSVAFNLNTDQNHNEPAHTFYFDNLSFKTGYIINDVRNDEVGGFQILFTEYTNMPDLVKSIVGKKRRVVLPEAIAQAAVKITVDGVEVPVDAVEYDRDGSLYAFFSEEYGTIADGAKIVVTFTNPEDAKYRLLYTRGDNLGNAVENFEQDSEYDGEISILPSSWLSPDLEESDPEEGSFCLPASTKTFTLTFDKPVKATLMVAKLDGSEALTVVPDAENEAVVKLMRAPSAAALAEGKHKINVTKVYAKNDEQMYEDSPVELTFSVGEPAVDAKLQRALDAAQAVLEESEDARYQGEAYTALQEAVDKYNAEAINYTKPSEVQAALDELSVKNEAQSQHFNRCKKYDDNLAKAEGIVDNYADSKYAALALYSELATAVGKYRGKVLTDDAELDVANKDLEANVKAGENMFTEGQSNNGDCGVKVLVDRIRQGAESLKNTFGYTDEDELIVAANNAVTDDDALAGIIKNSIKTKVYEALAKGDTSFFTETEEDGNTILGGPDLTVFIKNPNMYALLPKNGINPENTPGWEKIDGNMGLYGSGGSGWGNPRNIEGLPEDCAFTIYQQNTRAEQTITDLPAGKYIVTLYGSDWGNKKKDDGSGVDAQGFVYAKLSDTPAVEEGAEEDRDVNFAATATCEYAGQYQMNKAHELEVEVKDGKLTIGMQFCSDSQYFFGDVKLRLVGAADGVNYAEELEKFQTGIETVKTTNSAVFYDLQGRRVAAPSKGLYIKNNKKVVIK